ncbi:MAG: hypothetical protein IJK87_00175 [Prevotella sp.]|nr:hypothetical protein [Prevotella sp.]
MRKAIFIFIAIVAMAVCFDWIQYCTEEKSDKEQFSRDLTFADMYEYKDRDYGFVVRYPAFFTEQPDSLKEHKGSARFVYRGKWVTVVLEGYVIRNHGQSVEAGMDSLAQVLHASERRHGKDYFILSGSQYEDGSRMAGYNYHSKFVKNGKLWFVYTMVYPDEYRVVLARLFKEIDGWQVWEQPRMRLKQGESQTPKATPEGDKDGK